MATAEIGINPLLEGAKSREAQRAMFAEMAGDKRTAARHFLAAAHMELVLAADYMEAEKSWLALRSQISAASCFWRAGKVGQAKRMFQKLSREYPGKRKMLQEVVASFKQPRSPR